MLTKDQAEQLAPLIRACRPADASKWDTAGVMAALWAVRNRPLPEIIRAATRAAEDVTARTPAVLAARDSFHWFEKAERPDPMPTVPIGSLCGVCSKPEHAETDHAYERRSDRRLAAEDAKTMTDELRDIVAKAKGDQQ
jgi:hypothetical protein